VSELPESRPTVDVDSPRGAPFAFTIFLSAFLLFQVQPLIAKQILPWFGGSAAVWTTCMLFFQIALLLGYAYAHWLTKSFTPRRQAIVHISLLCVSLISLPIIPSTWWKPAGGEDPLVRILGLLAVTIGLPYFLLSSTSPLLQAWMARKGAGGIPYRFFALSNLGSMLALLSYPVLAEPLLANRPQAWSWSAGYALFALFCGYTAFRSRDALVVRNEEEASDEPAPSAIRYLLWIALAASASALLLSVTNFLTANVASIPFLWILPLALYLLSFILCFESSLWYRRILFLPLFTVALGTLAYGLIKGFGSHGFPAQIGFYCGALFVCCMVCHGELARTKPGPRFLTGFYLMTSVGGATGGLFVAFLAPRIFNDFHEFPIAILFCALTVVAVYFRNEPFSIVWRSPRQIAWMAAFFATAYMANFLYAGMKETSADAVFLTRNFYGALRVSDAPKSATVDALRSLVHGTINHGDQFKEATRHHEGTTYYGPQSGIGRAMADLQQFGPMKVGVVGLGTGSLASYSRSFDTYRFYEINPEVLNIARKYFYYLSESPTKVDVQLGDARLSMEAELAAGQVQGFDVLAVDAFSGDSIPVHLLTSEAFQLYWRHLKPDGILAVHVSNLYLDLEPIVELQARAVGKQALLISNDENEERDWFRADWILVTDRKAVLEHLKGFSSLIQKKPGLRAWTDDYSNLWKSLK
jgi:SAM-dependent methyltransferase